MGYEKGELIVARQPCETFREQDCCDHDDECRLFYRYGRIVALPHQCDEWIIGGEESIGVLISDLMAAIPALRGGK